MYFKYCSIRVAVPSLLPKVAPCLPFTSPALLLDFWFYCCCLFYFGRSHLAVFRAPSSVLRNDFWWLGGLYGVPGIKSNLAACKTSTYSPCTIALTWDFFSSELSASSYLYTKIYCLWLFSAYLSPRPSHLLRPSSIKVGTLPWILLSP